MRIPNNLHTYRLLGAINLSSPFGLRDHRMIMFALHTGLRVSELSFLDVHHVFRDGLPREVLDLPASLAKLHRSRLIPLNSAAQRALGEILAFNRSRGLSVDPSAPLLQNREIRSSTRLNSRVTRNDPALPDEA